MNTVHEEKLNMLNSPLQQKQGQHSDATVLLFDNGRAEITVLHSVGMYKMHTKQRSFKISKLTTRPGITNIHNGSEKEVFYRRHQALRNRNKKHFFQSWKIMHLKLEKTRTSHRFKNQALKTRKQSIRVL